MKNVKNKKKGEKKTTKILVIALLVISLFLVNVYIILGILYKGGNFTVTLDSENGRESGLVIYENKESKIEKTYLKSKDIDFFTDISVDWLPKNINEESDGAHNGDNYIAYTFYAENKGEDIINYWTKVQIDDVIKDVDEAIRVMVFKNDQKTIYAKPSKKTGLAEEGTQPFYSVEDKIIMLQQNENFKVGDVDKYTIVIWLEGDDPECTDELIGGEIKMHMTLTEEHLPDEKAKN